MRPLTTVRPLTAVRPLTTGRLVAPLLALALVAACAGGADAVGTSPGGPGPGRPPVGDQSAPPVGTEGSDGDRADPSGPVSTTPGTTPMADAGGRPPIVLGFAGDTSFTAGAADRDPLAAVTDLLASPDLMVVNLETAVADEGVGVGMDKEFTFRSPPASLDLLVAAGVDVVTLANNHVLDYGPEAVDQTLRELDARGLGRAGAGHDPAEAYRPLVVEVGRWTVAVVSLARVPCDWSASGVNVRPQVAWACPPFLDQVDATVAEAAAAADVVVAMVHGGVERDPCPSPAMAELVARLARSGVDLVVNSHPHVLQGVEQVGGALVVHSTGNFAFPSARGASADSAVFWVTVAEAGLSLRVHPVRVPGGVVTPAVGPEGQAILDELAERSFGFSFAPDGTASVDPTAVGRCGTASAS